MPHPVRAYDRQHGRFGDRGRAPPLAAAIRRGRPAGRRLHDAVGCRGRPGLRAPCRDGVRRLRADRLAGGVPVHPRPACDRVPGQAVDDPAVRRVRQRRADQRALPDDPRRRWRRPVGCVRHADPDGPRLRRPEVARRGRALRRRDRLGRRHGGAVRRHPAGRRHDLDDDQRSRRTGLLHVPRRGGAAGRGHRPARRDAADRHLQGVHRAEGVAVPARAAPAADRRPDGVLRRRDPAVQADLGVGVPHPGGRLDRRAGAGVHPGRRVRLRRARALARARRQPVRTGAVVLLRRARRLLRGDREVPRRAPDLGALAARRVRRDRSAGAVAALPHPDRGRLADRAAAGQQRRADRRRGARRRARWHELLAHQRAWTRCSRCRARRPRRSRCGPSWC